MPARFVEAVRCADILKPVCGGIFGVAERDAGADRAACPHQQDHERDADHQQVEGQKERVVKRGDREADHGLQNDRECADQQAGHCLLHGVHIEVPVEQVLPPAVFEERVSGVDGPQRNLCHLPRVKAPGEHLHRINAQRRKQRGNQQQKQQCPRQRHQRGHHSGVSDRIDQHLHRNRCRQRQHRYGSAVDQCQSDETAFRGEHLEHPAHRLTRAHDMP